MMGITFWQCVVAVASVLSACAAVLAVFFKPIKTQSENDRILLSKIHVALNRLYFHEGDKHGPDSTARTPEQKQRIEEFRAAAQDLQHRKHEALQDRLLEFVATRSESWGCGSAYDQLVADVEKARNRYKSRFNYFR